MRYKSEPAFAKKGHFKPELPLVLAIARIKAQKARRAEEKNVKSSASGTDETA